MLFRIIKESEEIFFERIGRNIYAVNSENNIRISIKSNTYRIITVDKIKSKI